MRKGGLIVRPAAWKSGLLNSFPNSASDLFCDRLFREPLCALPCKGRMILNILLVLLRLYYKALRSSAAKPSNIAKVL